MKLQERTVSHCPLPVLLLHGMKYTGPHAPLQKLHSFPSVPEENSEMELSVSGMGRGGDCTGRQCKSQSR